LASTRADNGGSCIVGALASHPRGDLRDDCQRAQTVSGLIGAAARRQEVSWSAIHGEILTTYQIRSYRRLPQYLVSPVEKRLIEYTTGARVFARSARAVQPADQRQSSFRFDS
jgi:hypothetical protein